MWEFLNPDPTSPTRVSHPQPGFQVLFDVVGKGGWELAVGRDPGRGLRTMLLPKHPPVTNFFVFNVFNVFNGFNVVDRTPSQSQLVQTSFCRSGTFAEVELLPNWVWLGPSRHLSWRYPAASAQVQVRSGLSEQSSFPLSRVLFPLKHLDSHGARRNGKSKEGGSCDAGVHCESTQATPWRVSLWLFQ